VIIVVICVVSALWTIAITALILRFAGNLKLVQAVNDRSSHVRPTPTGGGVGFVTASALASGFAVTALGQPMLVLTVLALAIAALGLADDILELKAGTRFAIQGLALAILVWQQPIEMLGLPLAGLSPIVVGLPVVLMGLWWVNLFNFMDGIDGLAASQALLILLASFGLVMLGQPDAAGEPVLWWMLSLAAALAAFLVFNWPPASIFMGDVGSTYLAFVIFGLALVCAASGWIALPIWAILGATLIVDTSVTLITRMSAGERWLAGHRQHAYQHLSRHLGGHRTVTLLYGAVVLLWLVPIASLAHFQPGILWPCVVVAYLPLLIAAVSLKAGRRVP